MFWKSENDSLKANPLATVCSLFSSLNIPFSKDKLEFWMTTHPNYPSLACISDILNLYKIENLGVSVPFDKIEELPVPFIAHINDREKLQSTYALVKEINTKDRTCLLELTKGVTINSLENFSQNWTGNALIVNKVNEAKEPVYDYPFNKDGMQSIFGSIKYLILAVFLTIAVYSSLNQNLVHPSILWSLILIKCVGLFVVITLLGKDFSIFSNELVDQFCKVGGLSPKFNCDSVLKSGASAIFGFKMSELGFFYFCGTLLIVLFTSINANADLQIESLFYLNLVAIPYTFFSLFYQIRILKSLCVLCIIIQFIFALELLILLGLHPWELQNSLFRIFELLALCFGIPLLTWLILRPNLQAPKEHLSSLKRLNYFLYDKETIERILQRQSVISSSYLPNDIMIGNQKGIIDIIAVLNPYCRHCEKDFNELNKLVSENNQVKLTVRLVESGVSQFDTLSFLLLQMRKDNDVTVLSNWYKYNWSYEKLKSNCNSNFNSGDLISVRNGIATAQKWIELNDIRSTPTIIINNRIMPRELPLMDFFVYFKGIT